MRTPSRGVGPWARFVALALMSAIVLAACAEAAPSIVPTTSRPTPVITPDPHLTEPTTADDVYRGLGASGLRITANNATAGGDDSALVKRINATYLGWPLNVSQYRTTSALAKATDWKTGQKPGQGEAPVAIAAANILITWGPQTGERPVPPDERQMQGLKDLLSAMDRLLSPIRARTIVAVSVPGLILGPTAAPTASADATTADGGATPKP